MSACRGSSTPMWRPEAPACSASLSASLYQSSAAVGPCHTCGDIPSKICMGSAHVAVMAAESPLLKASTYRSTAVIGSSESGTTWPPLFLLPHPSPQTRGVHETGGDGPANSTHELRLTHESFCSTRPSASASP